MTVRAIKDLLLKSTTIRDTATHCKEIYRHWRTDCYVVSFPKCGRTWIRMMLAKALALSVGDSREIVWDPRDVIERSKRRHPFIQFTHDGVDFPPLAETRDRVEHYRRYRRKRVILLVRDPRDTLVSYYFHRTRRQGERYSTIDEFAGHPWWGADRLVSFVRDWHRHSAVPQGFLIVRYEDLHRDAVSELQKILAFAGLPSVSIDQIRQAVQYASFENMRQLSTNQLLENRRLAPTDPLDPDSYKVRQGKVGGYSSHLTTPALERIEGVMARHLPCALGYSPCQDSASGGDL